jgi:gas vesicle protein
MNDKYIQAIIIGALIGGSIIVAELISQPKRNNMKLHTVELQKDIKDIETFDVKDKKIIVKVNAKNKDSNKELDINVEEIVDEVLSELSENKNIPTDDIEKIIAKALEGTDGKVQIEVSREFED